MLDSLRVDAGATFSRYFEIHQRWERNIIFESECINNISPDLLISNISYFALSAAKIIGVRSIAYSSLNWADVFHSYCGIIHGASTLRSQMADAYAQAEVFLQPQPSMPMPSIENGQPVGPVARLGAHRRGHLRHRLGLAANTRILLLSMGGIPTPIDYSAWPRQPGLHVVIGSDERPDHADVVSWRDTGMPFIDLVASCDVLLAKPGYGLFVEAVCNGVPLLHIPRPGWPETDAEMEWLKQNGRGACVPEADLRMGRLTPWVESVLSQPKRKALAPSGINEVANEVSRRL